MDSKQGAGANERADSQETPRNRPSSARELGQQIIIGAHEVSRGMRTSPSLPGSLSPELRPRTRSSSVPDRERARGTAGNDQQRRSLRRPPSVFKLCRYGDQCYTKDCQFGHPNKSPKFIPRYPKEDKPAREKNAGK